MQRPRPREEWIDIPVPAIVTADTFQAAGKVSRDNSQWSPRNSEPGHWLLRGLLTCGRCDVGLNCHKVPSTNGTIHRYYYCRNHDELRAGGPQQRCTERHSRAGQLDTFVFDQIRDALTHPDMLLAGQTAVVAAQPPCDDELLTGQFNRLDRNLAAAAAEHRRLIDCYQTGLIDLAELQRRATDVDTRHADLLAQRDRLATQRAELANDNQLRQRIGDFARRTLHAIDNLDFDQRQTLLRLVIEQVRVTG